MRPNSLFNMNRVSVKVDKTKVFVAESKNGVMVNVGVSVKN